MKALGILVLFVIVIALIVLAPFAVIWALNTLFGLTIAYTVWTWLAAFVLTAVIGGGFGVGASKSK